jgi:single-strand DNA-binding protein
VLHPSLIPGDGNERKGRGHMLSVNRVMLVGHLGNEVELRATGAGQPVANFSIATNETWMGKDGKRQERTEWHRIVVFGPQAEASAKYLGKGSACLVEGRIQSREWLDKENKPHLQTEVVASSVQFLSKRKGGGDAAGETAAVESPPGTPPPGEAPAIPDAF